MAAREEDEEETDLLRVATSMISKVFSKGWRESIQIDRLVPRDGTSQPSKLIDFCGEVRPSLEFAVPSSREASGFVPTSLSSTCHE